MIFVGARNIAAAALAVGLLAGTAAAQTPREVSYALPSKSLVAAAPRIADELGLFAKHGLRPKFTYVDGNAQALLTIFSKSADFGMTATAEVITAAAKGQNLILVANHYNGLAGSLILSKAVAARLGVAADAPVAQRLKALNNVLLASVSSISSLTIAYKSAAASVGAEPRFTYMAVAAMNAALEAGAVEGIIVTAPFWTVPILKGTGVLWLSPAKGDLAPEFMPSTPSATVASREFVEANPDVVKRLATVFDDLAATMKDRPAEVKAVIVKLYPEVDEKTIDMILSLEGPAFIANQLTPANIASDIKYMTRSGGDFGPIDKVDPASILLRR